MQCVVFDMDGVLFDSMPNHAESCLRDTGKMSAKASWN